MHKFLSIKKLKITLFFSACMLCGCSPLLKEKFSNNKNRWELKKTDVFEVKIEDGKFHVEKFRKNKEYYGCLWYHKTIPKFNANLNFSIQFDVLISKADDDFNQFDFSWGTLGKENLFYNFSFSPEGSFRFNRFSSFEAPSNRWTHEPVHYDNLVKKEGYNTVKIIQEGGLCLIYFNDVIIFNNKINPVPGNEIGFQHCTKTAWMLDNLLIKNI